MALALLALVTAFPVFAAQTSCQLVSQRNPAVWRAALQPDQVAIRFIGHATFRIESPKGVTIETDYNDYVRSGEVPTIATMNKAHSTHYSVFPDKAIRHVLRGWNPDGPTPAQHDITVEDVRVRNVPTNIRSAAGTTEYDGNSIFVFEVGGLCIAHLGHLHHKLDPEHIRDLGRIDILLVPVDGSWTLDVQGVVDVMTAISPAIVIPMHIFTERTLSRFLAAAATGEWAVEHGESDTLIISRAALPAVPKIVVLRGR